MLHKLMHHPVMVHLRKQVWKDWGLLVLRLATGTAFAYHGYPKLYGNTAGMVAFFAKIHIPAPGFFAPFVGVVEFYGGLLLILGVLTRLIGLALMIDMLVAILAAKGLATWKGAELETLLFALSTGFLLSGAGAFSFDGWLFWRMNKEHADALPEVLKP